MIGSWRCDACTPVSLPSGRSRYRRGTLRSFGVSICSSSCCSVRFIFLVFVRVWFAFFGAGALATACSRVLRSGSVIWWVRIWSVGLFFFPGVRNLSILCSVQIVFSVVSRWPHLLPDFWHTARIKLSLPSGSNLQSIFKVGRFGSDHQIHYVKFTTSTHFWYF